MIKVLFFARLREQLGCNELAVTADIADVLQLRKKLSEMYPSWQSLLMDEQILTAVNQTLIKGNFSIRDGDEVAFFPPVTGG